MDIYKTIYSVDGEIKANTVTTSVNGLMSSDDKTKLDSLSAGLPVATSQTLGAIKVGSGLNVDNNGLLTVSSAPVVNVPVATTDSIGGVKVGSGLTVNSDGVLSFAGMLGGSASDWSGPFIRADNGWVRIGKVYSSDNVSDSTIEAPLWIKSWTNDLRISGWQTHTYLNDSNNYTHETNQINNQLYSIGIKCKPYIWAESGVIYTSDSRIKKNIVEINDDQSLKTLRNIKCYSYNYIDQVNKSNKIQIGFIAQQVNEHLPAAVEIQKSIIPSHMKLLENVSWNTEGNINKLYSDELQDVSGIKYRFLVADNEEDNAIPIELFGQSDNCFYFKKKWNLVFCYGKGIDDLHTITKDKLFALNFSATQEVDRIQQQQLIDISGNKNEIKNNKNELELLKLENETLKSDINEIKSINQTLIESIESIEKRLNEANI